MGLMHDTARLSREQAKKEPGFMIPVPFLPRRAVLHGLDPLQNCAFSRSALQQGPNANLR
jgi:hypothetical protein